MFDKIFKIFLLIILSFATYALYLHSQKDRYRPGKAHQILLDTQTGQFYQTPFSRPGRQKNLKKLPN